ncbi:hypothetical protein BG015_000224 [Linnemannia schmuckeri]|uniref:Uncharacterized protein n=1 Tax=Linnemannia schmuckeri TaxID=64567 RepID=A0A9P5V7R4_9FUNG|nr:hypothetical protein BG015_000224 [Linnemannia schmuckeri]
MEPKGKQTQLRNEIIQLDALLSQSRQDRPEIRAKSSIELVALVTEKTAGGVEEPKGMEESIDQNQLDAWIAIARGLGDDWPLVREAFREQLTVAFGKSEALRTLTSEGELLDRMMTRGQETVKLSSEKLALATGILSLVRFRQGDNDRGPSCQSWNYKRVDTLLAIAIKGWTSHQETPQATRFIELVTTSFSATQIVRSLGSMTTTPFAQSAQVILFVRFATTVLRSLELDNTTSTDSNSTKVAIPQVQDWGLTLWVCDKLRIPRVFATRSHLEDSPDNVRIATVFAESAHMLLECLGQILQIQSVDNTYTLHRVIMACAAFTNPKDIWNLRYPSLSNATMAQAEQNLAAIIQHTHWSVPLGSVDDNSSHDRNRNNSNSSHAIMIPGSFSDHVIQILEKEIRPCFANVQAHKVAQRAQATIEMHQEKMRLQDKQHQQAIAMVEGGYGDSTGSKDDGAVITTGGGRDTGKDATHRQQHQIAQDRSTRFKIAPVCDTPNDEDEFWTRMDNRSEDDPTLPKRWDVDFLEAVPIVEWCAQQSIQDRGRILEVFMVLVGPILALAETVSFRYRVRGLDLLSQFLLRYHDTDNNNNTIDQQGPGRPRPAAGSRIWIKIFERTGLDQVLERTLTPLLAPIQAMFSPAPGAEDSGDSEYSLEVLNAAFGAYLTLILVNTEPGDKPTSITDDSHRIPLSQQYPGASSITTALTIENLFIHGLLGSFKRASPSKEYRTVVLEWIARLVRPVVPLDFLLQGSFDPSLRKGFQGIYGMGSLTIKYLPTLIPYLCSVLEYPLPSSPLDVRLESLTLAWRASEALYHVMDVTRARIPRHRGQLLATICKCWANSRIFPLDSTSQSSNSNLEQEQARLDESLVRSMRLCIEISQTKITDDSLPSGLEKDLTILRELDPAVFSTLFASS